jgi:hypothetical protein
MAVALGLNLFDGKLKRRIQWMGESSFVDFLNQDYTEEDEEDEFKVFFASSSSFSA